MQDSASQTSLPPFSPVLLASLALQPLPIRLFSAIAGHMLDRIELLYPEIFDRLAPLGHCVFHIIPTDFHCSFLVTLDDGKADLVVCKKGQDIMVPDATIAGPLLSLIQLLEGRVDGDALFFSRELTVQGDTEAVLTLRNAVDSVDISLDQLFFKSGGPVGPAAKNLLGGLTALYQKAHSDLDLVRRSLLAPLARQISLQNDDLDRQEEKFKLIEKEIRKMKAALKRNTATAKES